MGTETQQMSWRQIGCLWIVALALWGILYRTLGWGTKQERSPEAVRMSDQMKQRLDQFKAELEHPKVEAAFDAGYAFGCKHKQTGLSKLSDQDTDAFALVACEQLKVPKELRGHAVRKFKAGYGWGFWGSR